MDAWEAFYGPNVGYALELYERYLHDPGSVDQETRAFFDRIGPLRGGASAVATLARPATRISAGCRSRTTMFRSERPALNGSHS